MAGSCEEGNKTSEFRKRYEFLDQLLMNDCTRRMRCYDHDFIRGISSADTNSMEQSPQEAKSTLS
jgi:hypothetical protein